MRDGAVAGFKYFTLDGLSKVGVTVRGDSEGAMSVAVDEDFSNIVATIELAGTSTRVWKSFSSAASAPDGAHALYFRYEGDGTIDFKTFDLG